MPWCWGIDWGCNRDSHIEVNLCAPRTDEIIEKARRGELTLEEQDTAATLLDLWRRLALNAEATIHDLTKG